MSDVARLAGVSHQTVSRVLNDHPNVRPATKERVLAAIAELGYRRNSVARALARSRTEQLGIVVYGETIFGPVGSLVAIEDAAREAGYFLAVAPLHGSDDGGLGRALEHFLSIGVEGIVAITPQTPMIDEVIAFDADVPVVAVAAGVASQGNVHTVAVDQAGGARLATRCLVEHGHTRIDHIAGPLDWVDAAERVKGFEAELADQGLPPGRIWPGTWIADSGYRLAAELAADPPTGVFAANDQIALGLVLGLAELGLRVPEDISVVGFDDIPGSEFFRPPLTTIRQDFTQLGRRCVETVLAVIDDGVVPDPLVPAVLVDRASVAAPASLPPRAKPR